MLIHLIYVKFHILLFVSLNAAGGRHGGGRGRGDDSLLGTTVKIRLGPFKGYRGPVVEVKGNSVRVELEMKIVTGKPLNSLLRMWVSTCRRNSNNILYMQLIGMQYQIMLRQHPLGNPIFFISLVNLSSIIILIISFEFYTEIHLGIVWEAKHLCILLGLHFILI